MWEGGATQEDSLQEHGFDDYLAIISSLHREDQCYPPHLIYWSHFTSSVMLLELLKHVDPNIWVFPVNICLLFCNSTFMDKQPASLGHIRGHSQRIRNG